MKYKVLTDVAAGANNIVVKAGEIIDGTFGTHYFNNSSTQGIKVSRSNGTVLLLESNLVPYQATTAVDKPDKTVASGTASTNASGVLPAIMPNFSKFSFTTRKGICMAIGLGAGIAFAKHGGHTKTSEYVGYGLVGAIVGILGETIYTSVKSK